MGSEALFEQYMMQSSEICFSEVYGNAYNCQYCDHCDHTDYMDDDEHTDIRHD